MSSLLNLSPQEVTILKTDCCGHHATEQVIPCHNVAIGSRMVIKPGTRIPLDGRVESGESEINQAPLTGESRPRFVCAGDALMAGSINGSGLLVAISTKTAADSAIQKTLRLINEAQCKKAPSEQWIETFARIYTPAVLGLALLTALLPPLVFAGSWREWFYRALVLLVISCPCALVLSTPISIVAGLATAARQGVLIKGGRYLEALGKIRAVVFDKTGTLTQGRVSVTHLLTLQGHSEDELLARAASLSARSQHHLAQGVARYAESRGIALMTTQNVQNHVGKGMSASLQGKDYWLGSKRMVVDKFSDASPYLGTLQNFQKSGESVIAVGNAEHICGFLALKDLPRPEAQEALLNLRKNGIVHLALLTGDATEATTQLREAFAFDEVAAELMPEDKVNRIQQLSERYGAVAMVGDGINDAPALAASTVGIAMAGADSDTAMEHADVTLLSQDLRKIPWVIQHSQKVVGIIQQNIFLALMIKIFFLVLTFLGLTTLWGAIAADLGATLLVIGNALRLMRA